MPEVTTPEACQILGVSPQRDASHVDALTLLAEAKLELERIQKQIFADDSRDVSDVTHIAARLTAFVVHVKDRVRIDCGEIIAIINEFLKVLAVASNLYDSLRKKSIDKIDCLSSILEDAISLTSQLFASDFRISNAADFKEISQSALSICCSRYPYSLRHYVALIKAYSQLLEKVDDTSLLSAAQVAQVAPLIHHMGREIESSLVSLASERKWKLVVFLVKRTVSLSEKCGHASDDRRFIATVSRLYELQLLDHPLSRTLERVSLRALVQPAAVAAMASEETGIGFVLLCCDISEHLLRVQLTNQADEPGDPNLTFCLRAIVRHALDIVTFMFCKVGQRPVFDRCLHVICRGAMSLGVAAIFGERHLLSRLSLEQRLLHSEVCRYLNRRSSSSSSSSSSCSSGSNNSSRSKNSNSSTRLVDQTHLIKELERDPSSSESRDALASFFRNSLEAVPMSVDASQLRTQVKPCSSNSALLAALLATLCAESAVEKLSLAEFIRWTAEYVDILSANPDNDCLFLSACVLFSYLRDVELKSVENVALQAPIVRLKEVVTRRWPNEVLNAYGATSLAAFAFGSDLPKWLKLGCPSHFRREYFDAFAKQVDGGRWKAALQNLATNDDAASRPVNSFVTRPSPNVARTEAAAVNVKASKEPLVNEVFKVISKLESSPQHNNLTAEDFQILKLCVEKLETILRRPHGSSS